MRAVLALALLAACTDNTVTITPIIDIPLNDNAQVLNLDTLTLSVAHAGTDEDVASQTFVHGDVIELANVPYGDDLVVHMVGRSGLSEVGYGRTCQFSVRPDARAPTPHLFFSKQVKFGHLSQQPLPRYGGAAMMYRDGSGLLVGGAFLDPEDPDGKNMLALTQIERFDPSAGAYGVLHDVERRLDPAVAIVGTGPDSRMVIVGGLDPVTKLGADFVEVIEAERNTDRQYEKFAEYGMQRVALTATTLIDGSALVIGGLTPANPLATPPTVETPSDNVREISVDTGTTAITELRAKLKYPRYAHSATRLTNDLGAAVLVAGGLDALKKPIKQAELYKPLLEGFSDQFSAAMIVPRWEHQAARLPDGSVLFIGGKTIDPLDPMQKIEPTNKLELFSPLDGRFLDVGKLPDTAGRIGMSATVLPDGRVLITGGKLRDDCPPRPPEDPKDPACEPVNSAFIASLDPFDGSVRVVATDHLAVPRSGHQATLLCDGTVLISGGTPVQESFERYNPPAFNRR